MDIYIHTHIIYVYTHKHTHTYVYRDIYVYVSLTHIFKANIPKGHFGAVPTEKALGRLNSQEFFFL